MRQAVETADPLRFCLRPPHGIHRSRMPEAVRRWRHRSIPSVTVPYNRASVCRRESRQPQEPSGKRDFERHGILPRISCPLFCCAAIKPPSLASHGSPINLSTINYQPSTHQPQIIQALRATHSSHSFLVAWASSFCRHHSLPLLQAAIFVS